MVGISVGERGVGMVAGYEAGDMGFNMARVLQRTESTRSAQLTARSKCLRKFLGPSEMRKVEPLSTVKH